MTTQSIHLSNRVLEIIMVEDVIRTHEECVRKVVLEMAMLRMRLGALADTPGTGMKELKVLFHDLTAQLVVLKEVFQGLLEL